MTTESPIIVDYRADLFVTPQRACRRVLAQAEAWLTSPRVPEGVSLDQVLLLVGERGIGKTWLLRHLAEQDPQLSPLALYPDLEERAAFETPEQYVAAVEALCQQHTSPETVLLLDTVPPGLDEHLRALEDTILRPYLAYRRALVVMALVHPSQVCWRAPDLRAGMHYSLTRFEGPQTAEQVYRLESSGMAGPGLEALAVHDCSGGLPLLNYLLATRQRLEAFQSLLDYWFSRVPEDERQRVRNYLDAVCTLDCLEQAPIQQALQLFFEGRPEAEGCPAHPLGVLNLLRKHWLGCSRPDLPGHIVLVESVRRAARELLKARDVVLYSQLEMLAQILGRRQA